MIRYLIILLLVFNIGIVNSADIAIITSKTSNLTITRYEVRQLFLMKRKRLNTGEITVLVQFNTGTYLHKKFVKEVLDLSVEQYNQIIDNSNNSGYTGYAVTVNTKEEMIKRVSETEFSIGYIDSDYLIINSNNNSVNVYKIVD